jgi:hypothetical protein
MVNCATKPVIIYLEPDPPIFSVMPENAQLEDAENITANEYKLMINIIQFKIWGHYVRKTVKLITAGDYQVYLDQYNKQIDDINTEIEKLKLLE